MHMKSGSWETLPRRGAPLHVDAKKGLIVLMLEYYVLFCLGLMKFFLIPKKKKLDVMRIL